MKGESEIDLLMRLGKRMEEEPELLLRAAAEWLKVRDREGRLLPLVANAAQRRFEQRKGRQNIVLKARQMGITTWVAGRFFLRTVTKPGSLTLQVAHTRAAAEAIFQVVQRMWDCLPEAWRNGALKRSRANAGQMVFPAIDAEYRVASACDASAGRGLSVQNLHCSEVSRWPGTAAETLAGLRAALAPEGEMVLESTPSGAYGAFYEEWAGGVDEDHGGDALVRHFLPWWMEPAYAGPALDAASITAEERLLMDRHGLTAEQIGFRRGLEKSYGSLRLQEFAEDAETCFRATGSCFFDVEGIDLRMREVGPAFETRRGGALQIWLRPVEGGAYLVGVDSAGGGEDGDFAAVQVIDRATGLQCAELKERLRPAELAKAAVELAKEYGGAVIVVERNNHGAAVLAYIDTSERYGNVYRVRGESGWLTTAASKPAMVARIGALLRETPQVFQSRRLLGECRTFVAGERGSTGAASGAHDDLVMAMAVAQAARMEREGSTWS
jgi:hypothetical protein